ncbi:hypothetical protein OXPF_34030 [Oxobacter pfennigii]|uniref:Uncharacterized protein n=1 Tax=Oxobacter pfennigii TaxID=36849 RepID=A0A0P8YTF2_9CLOT|nr:hypothetical protein [Oxobacter pfennigii]KPU42972.1 hypothetical protein OXPF_34030 [Oxobacter pfennigii]
MIDEQYNMIVKRKSFRRFNDTLSLSNEELQEINQKVKNLEPLLDDIVAKYRIVPREKTTSNRGEYCMLIYSEEKNIFC